MNHKKTDLKLNIDYKTFKKLSKQYNTIPISTTFIPDYDTALSIYKKILQKNKSSLILESNENINTVGRYSIISSDPYETFTYQKNKVKIFSSKKNKYITKHKTTQDPIEELHKYMTKFKFPNLKKLKDTNLKKYINSLNIPFIGGAVGYFSFDCIQLFEPTIPQPPKNDLKLPDAAFMIVKNLIIFDHKKIQIKIISNAYTNDYKNLETAYKSTQKNIEKIFNKITKKSKISNLLNVNNFQIKNAKNLIKKFKSNTTKKEFKEFVQKSKKYIKNGDIFQVVPSQRFESNFNKNPIDLYRILRVINPSPYLFCLDFKLGKKSFSLVGSSPETHVRCENGIAELRPIAGTRWRGKTQQEDQKLAQELLNDEKELAEHTMLIDLARNDLGKVSEYGSVKLTEKMIIEKYSHVMHIVSNVKSKLKKNLTSYDLMKSTFPAGTVSGAPKIRAIEIIYELEKNKRNTYAGAISYFSFNGNLDSCIALRTCLLKNSTAYIQVGGGVVADSNSEYEYTETCNKAGAIMNAIEIANNNIK